MKHMPHLMDFSSEELNEMLVLAAKMKNKPSDYENTLKNKTLAMWFEKPSLRTRVSFETGMTQLGGHAIYLDSSKTHAKKASLGDEIRCLSGYVDIIMARVFDHKAIEKMIENSSVPVINGLSNLYHPCQAMADVMTIYETLGRGATVAYVGDGNNVCNSLITACKKLGIRINVAAPKGYEPMGIADLITEDPKEAVKDAQVVYTDTWVSMGDEASSEKRIAVFQPYQVNKELLGGRYFMHCLPAIRGQEVTDEVIDSPNSIVYQQAENRLHIQKAIMVKLLSN